MSYDIDALLDPKKAADAILGTTAPRNFAAGIAQPRTVRAEMLHGYSHGKQKGSPTHWPDFGQHFSWKPGELSVWTGYNNCFVGSTPVQTEMGLIPIDTVVSGMKVLSYNHDKGGYEYRKVLKTLCKNDLVTPESILTFVLTTGESISCTENHEFYDGSDYVSARVLAQRALAGNRGHQQPVLHLDLRAAADHGVEGNRPNAGNETGIGCTGLSANHDNPERPHGYREAAPLGGAGVLAEPVELAPGEPQKRPEGRQPGGEPGMDGRQAERATRLCPNQPHDGRHQGPELKADGSAGAGNSGEVCAAPVQQRPARKRVFDVRRRNQKDIAARTLETHLIAQVIERTAAEPVYDLTVQGNHNYTVGHGRYLAHNCGKTETCLQLMLLKSLRDGWKWAVFSPENEPVTEIFDQLAHALAGKSPDPSWGNQMPASAYERAMDFLFAHFFVVTPPEVWTLDCLLDYFAHLSATQQVHGCLLDPWNQLVHDIGAGGREDLYLSNELSKVKRFAQKHKLCFNITAHPTKPPLTAGEKWRCPDQFSLAGGAMWGNKADNVLAVHRPNYRENKADTLVEWHAHKIKKQKLVGRPGFVTLDFEYGSNRYTVNQASPLEPYASRIVAPELAGYAHHNHNLPASQFEEDPPF